MAPSRNGRIRLKGSGMIIDRPRPVCKEALRLFDGAGGPLWEQPQLRRPQNCGLRRDRLDSVFRNFSCAHDPPSSSRQLYLSPSPPPSHSRRRTGNTSRLKGNRTSSLYYVGPVVHRISQHLGGVMSLLTNPSPDEGDSIEDETSGFAQHTSSVSAIWPWTASFPTSGYHGPVNKVGHGCFQFSSRHVFPVYLAADKVYGCPWCELFSLQVPTLIGQFHTSFAESPCRVPAQTQFVLSFGNLFFITGSTVVEIPVRDVGILNH
ncbi:hypothetical protein J6590_003838 [Homalodisca vitripennis]|nr:hypothetical protein J6590_003838 [Homalodisca vitripennis]